jgi:sugar/nucleoside kinase (ribokinase family)
MAETLKPMKSKVTPRKGGRSFASSQKSVNDIIGQDLQGPIREILKAGVKYIVLTLGSQGAVLCSSEDFGQTSYRHYPALPASVVKLSGAGDCLAGGTLAALSRNVVKPWAVAYGVAAAKVAVESELNVPDRLSWEALSG